MSNNYTNTWLDTMQAIAKAEVEKVKFDQTIVATIISRDEQERNKYWVASGNLKFWAYADDNKQYSNNRQVYITIPQGDYNNKKIIIGSYETQKAEKAEAEETLKLVLGETISAHTNESKSWPVYLSPSLGAYDYVRWSFDLRTLKAVSPYTIKVMNGETAIYTVSSDELLGDPGNYLEPYHIERLFKYKALPTMAQPEDGTSDLVWSPTNPYLWRKYKTKIEKTEVWEVIGVWDETEAAAAKITTVYAVNNSNTTPPEDNEELWKTDRTELDTATYSQLWCRTKIEYIDYQGANEIIKSAVWVAPQIINSQEPIVVYAQQSAEDQTINLTTVVSTNPGRIKVNNSTLDFYYLKDKILPAGADYKIYNEVYRKIKTDTNNDGNFEWDLELLHKPYYYDPKDNDGNVVFRPLLVSLNKDNNQVEIKKYIDKAPENLPLNTALKWYQYRIGASSIYRSWWSEMAEFPSIDIPTTTEIKETISPWNFDIHTGTTVKVGDDIAPVFEGDDEHFVCCLVEGTNPETILATSSQISMYKKSYYTGEDVLEIVTPVGRSFLRNATTGEIQPETLTLEAYVAGNIDTNTLEWYYTTGSITSDSDWTPIEFITGQDRKTLTISWDSIKDEGVTTIYYKLVDPVTGKSDMIEIYSLVSGKDAEYFDLKSSTDIVVKKADGTYDPTSVTFTVSTDKQIVANQTEINWYIVDDDKEKQLSAEEDVILILNDTAQLVINSELVAGKKVKAVYASNPDWYDIRSISTYTGAEPIYKVYLSNEYMVFSGDVEAEEEGKPETCDDFDLEFNVYRDGELISDSDDDIEYSVHLEDGRWRILPHKMEDDELEDDEDYGGVAIVKDLFKITRADITKPNKFHFQWIKNPVTSDNSNPKGTLEFKAIKTTNNEQTTVFELPLTFGWSIVGKGADAQSFSLQTSQDIVHIDSNGNPVEAEIECKVQASHLFSGDPENERLLWTFTPVPMQEKITSSPDWLGTWVDNEETPTNRQVATTIDTTLTITTSQEIKIHVVYQSKQDEQWISTDFKDFKNIIPIADGQDPYICRLSNETIVWDNGVPDKFEVAVQVTKGMSEELPNISEIGIAVEENNWYSCTIANKTLSFQKIENEYPTSNSGVIPITVTLTDADDKILTFHLALSWSIVKDGAEGKPATSFHLKPSHSYVVKKKDGSYSPENGLVTFEVESQNLPEGEYTWKIGENSVTGQKYEQNITETTKVTVEYTVDDKSYSDYETIQVIEEGQDSLNIFLDNENQTFANQTSVITTNVYAFVGGTSLTSVGSIGGNPSSLNAREFKVMSVIGSSSSTSSKKNNALQVKATPPNDGTMQGQVTINVAYKISASDEVKTIALPVTWSLVRNGTPGAPATWFRIKSDKAYVNTSQTQAQRKVTFTIDKQNIADGGTYSWSSTGSTLVMDGEDSAYATINQNTTVTVTYTVNDIPYTDTETIQVVSNGTAGKNALNVFLSNENETFVENYGDFITDVYAFEGVTELTGIISTTTLNNSSFRIKKVAIGDTELTSSTDYIVTKNASTKKLELKIKALSLSAEQKTLTIEIEVKASNGTINTIVLPATYTLVKNGEDGEPGAPAILFSLKSDKAYVNTSQAAAQRKVTFTIDKQNIADDDEDIYSWSSTGNTLTVAEDSRSATATINQNTTVTVTYTTAKGTIYTDTETIQTVSNGATGASLLIRYINSATVPTITGNNVSAWESEMPTPEAGKNTYMTQKLSNATNWSTPIQISGTEGAAGKDGADIEFVYYRNNTGDTPSAPSYNSSNQLTTGWTQSPKGITETLRYEYVSVRTKPAGATTWSVFSAPVIWSKWGEKGQDGDGVVYKYYRSNSSTKPSYDSDTWKDEPQGVTSTYQYEYVVQIKTVDGVQQTPSEVALWAKYGATGATGASALNVFLDNENETFVNELGTITTRAYAFVGTNQLTPQKQSVNTQAGFWVNADNNVVEAVTPDTDNNCLIITLKKPSSTATHGTINIPLQIRPTAGASIKNMALTVTWSVAKDGKDGEGYIIGYKTQWYTQSAPAATDDGAWSQAKPPLYYNHTRWILQKIGTKYSVVNDGTGDLTNSANARLTDKSPTQPVIRYGTSLGLVDNGAKFKITMKDRQGSETAPATAAFLIPKWGSQISKKTSEDSSQGTLDSTSATTTATYGDYKFKFYKEELDNYYIRIGNPNTIWFYPQASYNANSTNNTILVKWPLKADATNPENYLIGASSCDFFSYGNNNGSGVSFNMVYDSKTVSGSTCYANYKLTLTGGTDSSEVYNQISNTTYKWLWKQDSKAGFSENETLTPSNKTQTGNELTVPIQIPFTFQGGIIQATIPNFTNKTGLKMNLTTYVQVPSYNAIRANKQLYGPTNLSYDSSGNLIGWEETSAFSLNDSGTITSCSLEIVKDLESNVVTTERFSISTGNVLTPIKHIVGTQVPCILVRINNTYYFPIMIHCDLWENQVINDWAGGYVLHKGESGKDDYILSSAFAAGSKNSDNQFTGVLMGAASVFDSNTNIRDKQSGLFGYKDGYNTFGLSTNGTMWIQSANNNSHYIGLNNSGELEISVQEFKLNTTRMSLISDENATQTAYYWAIDNQGQKVKTSYTTSAFGLTLKDHNDFIRIRLGHVNDLEHTDTQTSPIYGLNIYEGAFRVYGDDILHPKLWMDQNQLYIGGRLVNTDKYDVSTYMSIGPIPNSETGTGMHLSIDVNNSEYHLCSIQPKYNLTDSEYNVWIKCQNKCLISTFNTNSFVPLEITDNGGNLQGQWNCEVYKMSIPNPTKPTQEWVEIFYGTGHLSGSSGLVIRGKYYQAPDQNSTGKMILDGITLKGYETDIMINTHDGTKIHTIDSNGHNTLVLYDGTYYYKPVRKGNRSIGSDTINYMTAAYMAAFHPTANYIHVEASGGGGSWGSARGIPTYDSDRRLKFNIQDTQVKGLPIIRQLRHVEFQWKANQGYVKNGFIAQEIEELIPDAVLSVPQPDGSDIKQLLTHNILPYATKAIQELDEKIIELENQIQELKSQLNF